MRDKKELIEFLDDIKNLCIGTLTPFDRTILTEIKGIIEQSRQPGKVKVTREEVEAWVFKLFDTSEDYFKQCVDVIIDGLKSKGINVTKK